MTDTTTRRDRNAVRELPSDIGAALAGFRVTGALLTCVDPAKWSSMARPSAADLGLLILTLTDRLESGLEDLGFERAD